MSLSITKEAMKIIYCIIYNSYVAYILDENYFLVFWTDYFMIFVYHAKMTISIQY